MSEDATVGIVLVSHSAALAAGTAELAGQMAGGLVRIVAAGGTDDGRLGTSIGKLRRALAQADTGAGVLVLPDLGSSVLTVRAVLAEVGSEGASFPGELEVADAPFVEGAVAAVVSAASGADVKTVRNAAEEAWHARKL
jgi:phosphoenolpyruvate---glycerone phosphotransferase subunit DhaM